jgi:thiol-disulfide isomerase/thioredoxin
MPLKIGKDEFAEAVEQSELPVLADFYSDSCIPCKRMSPILSQLESAYAEKLKIVKINTNFEKELTEQFQIENGFLCKTAEQKTGGIRLRVTADNHDLVATLHKSCRQILGGGGLADTALAVNCDLSEFLCHKSYSFFI